MLLRDTGRLEVQPTCVGKLAVVFSVGASASVLASASFGLASIGTAAQFSKMTEVVVATPQQSRRLLRVM